MAERTQLPHWALLYRDFVTQTEASKLQEHLQALEDALALRLQELNGGTDRIEERIAIQAACDKVLEIKINNLGFRPFAWISS